jgi:hypothetical protein
LRETYFFASPSTTLPLNDATIGLI